MKAGTVFKPTVWIVALTVVLLVASTRLTNSCEDQPMPCYGDSGFPLRVLSEYPSSEVAIPPPGEVKVLYLGLIVNLLVWYFASSVLVYGVKSLKLLRKEKAIS